MGDKVHHYTGAGANIDWDGSRCIHAAECIRCVPAAFDTKARPWIQPDNSDVAALAEAVNGCPSGALSMRYADGTSAMAMPEANTCLVNANGPYYFCGRITLARLDDTLAEDTRMALCRCGASQNKPFCDLSHRKAGFAHRGALPAAKPAPADTELAAPLRITATVDGPLQCRGPLTLRDGAGTTAFVDAVYLCRCGGSGNKPYCDGTHRRIGFTG